MKCHPKSSLEVLTYGGVGEESTRQSLPTFLETLLIKIKNEIPSSSSYSAVKPDANIHIQAWYGSLGDSERSVH